MGTMEIQKQRLIKKCKIVLGENFCPDFIYEDVDFTKPSTIKEAYKLFESTNLDEAKKYEAGKYYAKFGGRVVGPYDTEKDAYHDTKGDVEWIKKGKDKNEFTEAKDGYIGKTVVYATKDTSGGGTTSSTAKSKVVKYDKKYGVLTLADGGKVNIKLHQRKNKKLYWKKDFYIESTEIEESSAAQRKLKTSNKLSSAEYEKFSKLKAFNDKDWKWNSKEGLYHRVNKEIELEAKTDKQQDIESLENMIKKPDPKRFKQYGGKDKYLKMLNTKLAKLKA